MQSKFCRLVEARERDLLMNGYKGQCSKRTVVCLGVNDGTPVSLTHNVHDKTCDCMDFMPEPSPNATHAEITPIKLGCDTLYITYQPCEDCASAIVESGTVKRVYYRDQDSKASVLSLEILKRGGVHVSNEWVTECIVNQAAKPMR